MGYGLGKETVCSKAGVRTVLLASLDAHFKTRMRQELTAMRWQVREASGGAETIALLEKEGAEALVLDSMLPDLEVGEFASQMRLRHPVMDLLRVGAGAEETGARSPRRNELLHALRKAQHDGPGTRIAGDDAGWALTSPASRISAAVRFAPGDQRAQATAEVAAMLRSRDQASIAKAPSSVVPFRTRRDSPGEAVPAPQAQARLRPAPLPEMVGESEGMLELARMVRLVAPRTTSVLIQGDTGTGKELVARAIHGLSTRSGKAFVVLNCAAIPESLLEAELFGHTRGAFTGAVQSRLGRIEAAHGGTLFLDEIGEMPLALQAKLLRFLESGELQRVGDNETTRVDVRVIAASHRPLRQRAAEQLFRLDLYHRLAVFPVYVPALRDRMEDVLALSAYVLAKLGEEMPVKSLSTAAAMKLMDHDWPGNVRELAHVLERGAILAEDRREIAAEDIGF